MGLLGVEIAIDKEPLQVEAQVSNFCQVNCSPGGKRRENILRSAIRALNPRKDSTRPMRLSMDLGGYRSLSNTILASNQDRAVAFRNMGKRTLNPRLNRRGKQFRIPLYGMDSDAACHESSQAYTLGLAMRVPKPGGAGEDCIFRAVYLPLGHLWGRRMSQRRQNFFRSRGKICDINSLREWKYFSTSVRQLPPIRDDRQGIHIGLSRSPIRHSNC